MYSARYSANLARRLLSVFHFQACDTNYLNFVLALAMLECIKSSWNSETGTNINHGKKALDRIEIDVRTWLFGMPPLVATLFLTSRGLCCIYASTDHTL